MTKTEGDKGERRNRRESEGSEAERGGRNVV